MAFSKHQEYQEALDYVYSFRGHKPSIAPVAAANYFIDTFLRLRTSLDALTVVQVTGTDGKGSVCAYLETILLSNRIDCIVFTSPHINSIRERIRVNRHLLAKQDFIHYLNELKEDLEKVRNSVNHLGPYQIMFIICLLLHSKAGKGFIGIYEVGIGGFSDYTNVLKKNIAAITEVSEDHLDQFGTLENLASDKIGIAKKGCSVVSQKQSNQVAAIFNQFCLDNDIELLFDDPQLTSKDLEYLIPGSCQPANYSLARRVCSLLSRLIGVAIDVSLNDRVYLKARMEQFLIQQTTFTLDTAHTYNAVKKLLNYSSIYPEICLIFACSPKRNCGNILRLFLNEKHVHTIFFTEITSHGGTPSEELFKMYRQIGGINGICETSLLSAVKSSVNLTIPRVFVFGSFRLARDMDRALLRLGYIQDNENRDPFSPWHKLLQ